MSRARNVNGWRLLGLAILAGMVILAMSPQAMAGDLQVARATKPFPKQAAYSDAKPIAPPPLDLTELTTWPTTFTIEGLTFDTDAPISGSYWRYPEPNGAVGPNHVVSIVNGVITWHTKTGTLQNSQRLARNSGGVTGSFFASLNPLSSGSTPRAIYDQYSGRFVVMVNDRTTSASAILLAVSDDNNPNGTWYFYKLNTAINVGGVSSFAYLPAIAVGPDAILITADFYNFGTNAYGGSRLLIVPKTPFYTGGAGSMNVYDPSTASGFPYQVQALMPVQTFGALPTDFVIFLVSPGWYSTATESYGEDMFAVIEVDGTSAAPTFPESGSGFMSLGGDISSESFDYTASQKGTTYTLDVGWPGASLMRDNKVWIGYTHAPNTGPSANQATVHWVKWDLELGEIDQGDIGGEELAAGTCTYYPSIAVNGQGSMALGFAASGPNLYPGAYYTGRLATDPAGTTDAPRTLAVGVDYYYRVFGSADVYNTMGFCSATVVDPTNDSFWTYNGYALARGSILSTYPTQDGRWGTRWGTFTVTGLPVDFDANGRVNTADYNRFSACLTGPALSYVGALPAGCTFTPDLQGYIAPDFDRDGDVDQADFGIFQRCYSGPGALNPNCMG